MDQASPVVVLVRPKHPANLGSVARCAKNFGAREIRLIEPACAPDEEAERLALGASDLLAGIRRYARLTDAVHEFDVVIATSSLRGRGERRPLLLSELPAFLAGAGPTPHCAFLFGPERSGLTEEERSHASATLTLPTEPGFPTMNLSHAVAIVLAVARAFPGVEASEPPEELAAAREVEGAVEHWDRALDAIGFYDTGHRERSLRDWRRIVAGRPLTVREAAILRGVANRVLVSLRRKEKA
jgi:TrmH family RNA methyltransferase